MSSVLCFLDESFKMGSILISDYALRGANAFTKKLTPLTGEVILKIVFASPESILIVELQWLEHLWNHEKIFKTGIVQANEC